MDRDDLAVSFTRAMRRRDVRAFLAESGFTAASTGVITIVSAGTALDEDVLRRRGEQVIRHAPRTEVGWEVVPRS